MYKIKQKENLKFDSWKILKVSYYENLIKPQLRIKCVLGWQPGLDRVKFYIIWLAKTHYEPIKFHDI